MSEIAQQLHEIASAIGELSAAIFVLAGVLAVVIGFADFDKKVARAIDRLRESGWGKP